MRNESYINQHAHVGHMSGSKKNPKRTPKMGKLGIDQDTLNILKAIIEKAKKERSHKVIAEIIKNEKLPNQIRTAIAIMYLNELKAISQKVFYRYTLKKMAKSIKAIEEILKEQGFKDTAQYLRKSWDTWIQKELWQQIGNKTQQAQQGKPKTESEIEILKSYLE